MVTAFGKDRTGIVYEVSRALAGLRVNLRTSTAASSVRAPRPRMPCFWKLMCRARSFEETQKSFEQSLEKIKDRDPDQIFGTRLFLNPDEIRSCPDLSDPILRKKTQAVTTFDRSLLNLVAALVRVMKSQPHGIGIAAPQIGSRRPWQSWMFRRAIRTPNASFSSIP